MSSGTGIYILENHNLIVEISTYDLRQNMKTKILNISFPFGLQKDLTAPAPPRMNMSGDQQIYNLRCLRMIVSE